MKKLILIVFIVSFSFSPAFSQRLKWKNFEIYRGIEIQATAYNPVNNLFYAIANAYTDQNASKDAYLLISKDSCKTWKIRNKVNIETTTFSNVNMKIDHKGNLYFVTVWESNLASSKDDGWTWDTIFKPIYYRDLFDYHFAPDNSIFVESYENFIYRSKNFGLNWDTIQTPYYYRMNYSNDKRNFIVSLPYRRLSKTTNNIDTILSSYAKINELIDDKFETIVFNSRNKFDSTTMILSILKHDDNYYLLTANENYEYYYDDYEGYGWYEYFLNKPMIVKLDTSFNIIEKYRIELPNYYMSPYTINKIFFVNSKNEFIFCWWKQFVRYDISQRKIANAINDDFPFYGRKPFIEYHDNCDILIYSYFSDLKISLNGGNSWFEPEFNYKQFQIGKLKNFLFNKYDYIIVDTNNRISKTQEHFLEQVDITPKLQPNQNITCLKKSKNNHIVIGTESEGILVQREDSTWEKRNKALASLEINDLIQTRTGDFYICTSKGLYYTNDEFLTNKFIYRADIKKVVEYYNSIYVITNDGKLISLTYNNGIIDDVQNHLNGKFITSVAANDSVVIAGTLDSGFYRTMNDGLSWQEANFGFYYQDVREIISTKNNEFIAISNKGAVFSNNNAESWEEIYEFDSRFKFIVTNNKIFGSDNFSRYVDSISPEPMTAPWGWFDNVSYLRHNTNLSNAKLSDDLKYMYNGGDSHIEIYDFKTGVKQKYYSEFVFNGKLYYSDYDTSGNLLYYLEKYVNNRRIYSIVHGNTKSGKLLFEISPLDSNHLYNDDISVRFSEKNNEIHAIMNVRDSTKDSSSERGYSVYYRMDKSGKIIETRKLPNMQIRNWGNDSKRILFNPNFNFKSKGGWGDGYALWREFQVYDFEKNKITEIDTTGIAYYHEFSYFSEDGKYLFLTLEDDHYKFISLLYLLDSDTSDKPLKYFRKLNFTPNSMLQLDSANYLCIVGESNYKFIIYNIKEDKITKYSRYPGLIVNFGGINRIPGTNEVMVRDKRYNLDKIMVDYDFPKIDFTANKTRVNSCRDTLIFEANYFNPDIEYKWDFGDGKIDYGIIVSHKYGAPGFYTVKLYYKDNSLGLSYSDSVVKIKYINVYADNFIYANKNNIQVDEEVEIGVAVDTCYICKPNSYYRYYFGDSTTKISSYSVKHSYAKPGIYDVSVVYSYSCNNKYYVDSLYSKALITVEQGTDVESDIDNQFTISPNPTTDYIEISYPPSGEGAGGVTICIFDILGIEVQKRMDALRRSDDSRFRGNDSHFPEWSSVRLDVSHLATGVYFVRVGDIVKKLIKI